MTPEPAPTVQQLLAFYLEAGVDCALGDEPVNRLADPDTAPEPRAAATPAPPRAVPPAPPAAAIAARADADGGAGGCDQFGARGGADRADAGGAAAACWKISTAAR